LLQIPLLPGISCPNQEPYRPSAAPTSKRSRLQPPSPH